MSCQWWFYFFILFLLYGAAASAVVSIDVDDDWLSMDVLMLC
jgi:hypothetical protein